MDVCDAGAAFDAAYEAGRNHEQAEAAIKCQAVADMHAASLNHEREKRSRLQKKFQHLIPPGQCPGNVDFIEEPTIEPLIWADTWTYDQTPVKIVDRELPNLIVSSVKGPVPLEYPDEAVCLVVWVIGWLMVPLTWRCPPPVAWRPDGSSR